MKRIHGGDTHFDEVFEGPAAGTAGVDDDGDSIRAPQVYEPLMDGAEDSAVEVEADHGTDLGSEIFPEPEAVGFSVERVEGPFGEGKQDVGSSAGEEEAGRVIRGQVHEGLFHGAKHSIAVDDVGDAWAADGEEKIGPLLTRLSGGGVIEMIWVGHWPPRHLLFRRVQKGEVAVIPITAGWVFDPASSDAPAIRFDPSFWNVGMELGSAVGRPKGAEIHLQGPQETFVVIRGKAEMFFEARVNPGIRAVIDGDTVGFVPCQGDSNAFARVQRGHRHSFLFIVTYYATFL